MRRLDSGASLNTEAWEFGTDGLRDVGISGPEISVDGSVLFLLETREEVKWISHAASYALASSDSVEGQERIFLEVLNQLPSQRPAPPDEKQMERLLSGALEDPDRQLTPLESLLAGCEGLAALMEAPVFGEESVGVVFAWRPAWEDRECSIKTSDELPMLILEHASLSATLLVLKASYTASKWMLAGYGWVRPNFTGAPAAAAWFVEQLRARAMTRGYGVMPLDRLDHPNTVLTYDSQRHSMAIVYVHGLFSTDAGTFDGFRDAWSALRIKLYTAGGLDRGCVEDAFGKVGHVGFPHDTLCGIDRSGQALADALFDRFDGSETKLALVAHSRGGLVTRRAIQHLLGLSGWKDRIKFFATFGTPHAGATLAQLPGRYEGSYLLLKGNADRLIALDMLFCYLKHVKRIEGIDDLQPVGNLVSTFLEDLDAREKKYGALDTWTVSGTAPQRSGWGVRALIAKAVRMGIDQVVGSPNDIVVTTSSAEAAPKPTIRKLDCDHFGYFSQLDGMKVTAREVMRALGLEREINACTGTGAPDISFDLHGNDIVLRIGDHELGMN